jgi:hypothetical protein
MADRLLFIGWSTPVRGREERGIEVFNEAIGIVGRMQQEGRIEKFDVVLLAPNGDLNGYIELHGSAEQLAAVREDEAFQRNTADASLVSSRATRRASRGFRRPRDAVDRSRQVPRGQRGTWRRCAG